MPRPIRVRFDNAALAHNLARVRGAAPDARVWAVVKANAYGHGLLRAAAALRSADGYALLDLAEAVRLREAGFLHPILLLEGVFHAGDLEIVDVEQGRVETAGFARPDHALHHRVEQVGLVPRWQEAGDLDRKPLRVGVVSLHEV